MLALTGPGYALDAPGQSAIVAGPPAGLQSPKPLPVCNAAMATPGVYVFKRNGRVAYVGRSDVDVDTRESASYHEARYDNVSTIHPRSSARQAYLTECRLFSQVPTRR
jgi:hypothetical protein